MKVFKRVLIILGVVCVFSLLLHQGEMEAMSSYTNRYSNGFSHNLHMLINQSIVLDKDALADEILETYREDELEGMRFFLDSKELPSHLTVYVYKYKFLFEEGYEYCVIDYEKISDNPIEYEITIK